VLLFSWEVEMPRRPAPSKSEMEVIRIVWDRGEATVREVLEVLPENREVDYKTVQTYLRRLESKGYLNSHKVGRSLVYNAKVKPRTVIHETISDLVNRLFGGNRLPLVEHLIKDQGLRPDELIQLKEMIKEVESGRDAR